MARLHKEFLDYDKKLKLADTDKASLKNSRQALRTKIRTWFKENKPNELSPQFYIQGSYKHDTINNPIVEKDEEGKVLRKYDLDDGVYFIEKVGEDNRRAVQTWHNWVYEAIKNHTKEVKRKTTCVRVVFSKGHHIDLPIYYIKEKNGVPELAHGSKGWIKSDPKEFSNWVRDKSNTQVLRIIRALKGWKNYRENQNSNLKLPSGFVLTILAINNYHEDDNNDTAFRETVRNIETVLNKPNGFKCYRPTTPSDEDLFEDFSETRKSDFLKNLENLRKACDDANTEKNFKTASEYLRAQFGDRFPLGSDEAEDEKSEKLGSLMGGTGIKPKPYGK